MAINLAKIQADLGHRDPQIQTFALISVTRLSATLVADPAEVRALFERLEGLIQSENPDVVFLARKATNHLRAHFKAALKSPTTPAAPVAADAAAPAATGAAAPGPPPPSADPAALAHEQLLAEIRATTEPQRLSALIIRLVERGAPADLPALAGYLGHENDRVRSNALEVFVKHGDRSHLELVKPLARDPSNRVRGTAVLALDRFGDPGAAGYLEEMLQLSAISMRETAVWVLGQVEKDWVPGLLIRALEDPYDGIRLRAVRSLAKYPSKDSIRALKSAMNDIDINICEAAAESLRALKVLIQGAQAARQRTAEAAAGPRGGPPPAPATPAAPGAAPVAVPAATPPAGPAASGEAPPAPGPAAASAPPPAESGGPDRGARAAAHRDLGTAIYQLCRLNAVTHDDLDAAFYEILRYQDFLRAFLLKRQKGAPAEADSEDAIRKLQARIARAFVGLGEVAEGLLRRQAIRVPGDQAAEVSGILARLGA